MNIPLFINSRKHISFEEVDIKLEINATFLLNALSWTLACITDAVWAKQGERGTLRRARNDHEARETPRSPRVARKACVMQATWTPKIK